MGLTSEDLAGIDALLGAADADARALASIKERFPKLSLTECSRSEVDAETPFREYARFDLYLVGGGGHCRRLTQNAAEATGLVVVARRSVA
jgi:precorrin-6B methylase 2